MAWDLVVEPRNRGHPENTKSIFWSLKRQPSSKMCRCQDQNVVSPECITNSCSGDGILRLS